MANPAPTPAEVAAMMQGESPRPLPTEEAPPVPMMAAPPIDPTPAPLPAEVEDLGPGKKNGKKPPRPSLPRQELAAMLPPVQRVHVFYRSPEGKLAFCNDYSINDLRGHGTIHAFVKKFCVPKYGPGDYHLFYQTPGVEGLQPIGSVMLQSEPDDPSTADTKMVRELIDKLLKQQQPESKPVEQLAILADVAQKLSGGKEGRSIDPMMLFFLAPMLQKRDDGTAEALKALLDRMERNAYEQKILASTAPPPPPPPPPVDPMASITPILTGFTTALSSLTTTLAQAALRPPERPPERDVLTEIKVIADLVKPDAKPDTVREVLELFPKVKEMLIPRDDQKDGFEKMLEHLKMLRILKEEFLGPGGGQASSGFWEFASQFINSGVGQSIADGIRKDMGQSAPAQEKKPDEKKQEDSVEIPESFEPFAKKMVEAQDTVARIGATVMALQHLYGFPAFRPYVTEVLKHAQANRKRESLDALEKLLGGIGEAGCFPRAVVDDVLLGFRTYWVQICQKLGFKQVTTDPDPVQPPASAAPASGPRPRVKFGARGQQPGGAPTPPVPAPEPEPEPEPEEDDEDEAEEVEDPNGGAAARQPAGVA